MQISVVIPTYNRANLLRAALQSVLSQTHLPREIVVVDDGSTDDTTAVVTELAHQAAARQVEILYLPGPHLNRRGEARNRGFAATNSSLVAFLDSDDLWEPQKLERQVTAFAKSPDVGFSFCNVQRFDQTGPVGDVCLSPSADYNGHILSDLLEEPLAVSSSLVVARDAFERVGGFAELRTNEDYELSLRLAYHYPASYIPQPLVLMREHEGRTSRNLGELPLLDYIDLMTAFLAAHPDLPSQTKARGKRGITNVHYKLARLYLERGDKPTARRHALALAKLRPWDRRILDFGSAILD
jgi:glycosyltransferase involved in cell wall biosynthesis